MTDHGQLVIEGAAPVNVAVASPHWPRFRTKIGTRYVDERFAKRRAPSLIANQRCEHVAFALVQKYSAGRADCFLSATKINPANDHSPAIHGSQFVLENSGEEHPTECFEIARMGQFRGLGSAAFRSLKHLRFSH